LPWKIAMSNRIIDLHLAEWKESKYRKPLILRGTRQVGKTVAVRKLGKSFKYFVEVNFEQLREAIKVFEKYARKSQIKYLEQLFQQIPHMVDREFSYKEIHGEYRKRELYPALQLLKRMGIIHIIRHSSGQGIPIGSEINFETFKVIYLDVALCQAILGSDISVWFLNPLEGFKNRGEIAESFIGQELICYASCMNKAELYFWKRKEKNSTAEVDYLVQKEDQILPVEVKSAHGNTLRSLHLFLETHPKSSLGLRFSALNYSFHRNLDSRPLYAAVSLAHESQKKAIPHLLKGAR
jgi:uncharacterized protein